jgi:hypothetical protein
MFKICGFAIKMIEICPKTEKSSKYTFTCKINHSKNIHKSTIS